LAIGLGVAAGMYIHGCQQRLEVIEAEHEPE
jgi:hypothetical protein